MNTALIPKDTLEELCAHRQRALERYAAAAQAIADGNAAGLRMVGNTRFNGLPRDVLERLWFRPDDGTFIKDCRATVDRQFWRYLINHTKLCDVMDAEDRKRFEDQIGKDPPEATLETVQATLLAHMASIGDTFKRGVVNLFKELDPMAFKRNDGIKLTPRIALRYVVEVRRYGAKDLSVYLRHSGRGDNIRDLERVLCVIDGAPVPDYASCILSKMQAAINDKLWEVETDQLHVRWYKNGNAHLTIKTREHMDRLNAILAEHGGLGDARRTTQGRAA